MNLTQLPTRWIITKRLPVVKFIIITILLAGCWWQPANKMVTAATASANKMYVTVQTYKAANGWGYSIYADGKLFIQQPFIPGIAGMHGFASQEDAKKAGSLVLEKMSEQQRFPVISRQEMQNLGITLP